MEFNKENALCFTGHRPYPKLNGYNPNDNLEMLLALKELIIDYIENKNIDTFISGMALGIDMWSARIVLKLKETYPHIKLVSAIPCKNHTDAWKKNPSVIEEWEGIVNRADIVHYVSEEPYTNWCMQVRNEWMVNNSSNVIAVWDGGLNGGTTNCVNYALKKDVKITQLHPKTLEVNKIK